MSSVQLLDAERDKRVNIQQRSYPRYDHTVGSLAMPI